VSRPSHIGKRRVPGLRRQEVASLAGVGVEYYKRLELSGVSELMREALAQALQLDDAERAHLFELARAAAPAAPRLRRVSGSGSQRVRQVVQRVIDQTGTPGDDAQFPGVDYVAANQLGRALYAPPLESREQPANSARLTAARGGLEQPYADVVEARARDAVGGAGDAEGWVRELRSGRLALRAMRVGGAGIAGAALGAARSRRRALPWRCPRR
jgi:hypothetical protein